MNMNNIKIFKTIKYALGILSICTLMSIATFSTQTKAEVSGEKVTTSVEAVTTKPSESTKTTETTKLAETIGTLDDAVRLIEENAAVLRQILKKRDWICQS